VSFGDTTEDGMKQGGGTFSEEFITKTNACVGFAASFVLGGGSWVTASSVPSRTAASARHVAARGHSPQLARAGVQTVAPSSMRAWL
jgi:hypothetical protein